MEAILSSAFKNSNIRVMEFFPIVDFRLFSFGFIDNNFLDGSGFKREQAESEEQAEEPQPITQVSLPSSLSLDDLLIPRGIGTLEQISYHDSKKIIEPQFTIFSYLFFDSAKPASLSYINPKYLIYAHFMPHGTTPYTKVYSHANSVAEYFTDIKYDPIEQPKPYQQATGYSIPYVAPVSLLY